MIKIGIVSDLHTEFWRPKDFDHIGAKVQRTLADADLILIPGDIATQGQSIAVVHRLFPVQPVVVVAGNHEFYGSDYSGIIDDLRAATLEVPNVTFLHKETTSITLDGRTIRIVGTTLWTDFDLYGTPVLSMLDAAASLNDFRMISVNDRLLTPQDTLDWHQVERQWLLETLQQPDDADITIVMTHHAPVSFGVNKRYAGDVLSPCFASRLENPLVDGHADLVVWGHTHHCIDQTIERTRFVSNQTGYPEYFPHLVRSETGQYGCVVEIS